MDVVITTAAICFILLATAFGLVFRKLTSPDLIFSPSDILEEPFSAERYRAMHRVLDKADENFILSHPGTTPKMKRNFRKVRARIFHAYMRLLSEDFDRICRAIRLYIIASKVDRRDLALIVVKERLRFAAGMMRAEFRLVMYRMGWKGVDASGLVGSLATMRDQLQYLAAVAEPTVA